MRLRTVVLDMQSSLYASALRRSLAQELTDCQIVISKTPQDTASECRVLQPYALLMEVTGYTPWKLSERLRLRDEVRESAPDCKTVLIVDEVADSTLADEVKQAKRDGRVDAFLFASATERYLAAFMDSL